MPVSHGSHWSRQEGDEMNLEQLIDKIRATPEEDGRVALGDIMGSLGTRSFGSFLVLAGLIVVLPLIGDIPGVPTLVGVIVALVSIQLLMGRKQFWLPQTMLKRSIEKARLDRAMQRLESKSEARRVGKQG